MENNKKEVVVNMKFTFITNESMQSFSPLQCDDDLAIAVGQLQWVKWFSDLSSVTHLP